ncbi:hypothetical protein NE548_09355, partial [Lactobacillus gasseri]|nr:hypothetical protein [Lactobacillus gasseri]
SHRNYKENYRYKIDNKHQKLKLKIWSRVWNFKNTMLKKRRKQTKKTKQGQKIIKYIYMKFAEEEKNRFFFFLQSNRL